MWSVLLSIGTNTRVAAGVRTTTTKTKATIKTIQTVDSTDLSFVYKVLSDTTYIQQQNTFQYSTITSSSTSNNSNSNNISEDTFHSLLNDTNHHNNSNNNTTIINLNVTHNNDSSAHLYDSILSWQGFCLIAVFCIFIVITIIGNTLVILAVITTRRLKTVTNCFVMSLAVADLLVGIFVMPPAVAVHLIGSWQLGWVLCDIWISLDVLLCTASILSLCAISIDRYLAVTQPLTYSRRRRSKRLALVMILIVWLLALAITCPPMLGWYEPGRRDLNECRYNQNEGYVIFSAMGSFFIPMAVMIYVYARISCVVASRHDNMTDISVHNKKCKRHLFADGDNEGEHDLSELEFSSSQKKSRTLSNQTLAKDITEAVIKSNEDNTGGSDKSLPTTTVPSQAPLPSKNGDNADELRRQISLKYTTTGGSVVNIQPNTSGRTLRNNAEEISSSFSTTILQQQQQPPQMTTQPTSTYMRSLSMRYQHKQQMQQQPQQLSLSAADTTQQESDNITITALSRQPTKRTQTTTTVHQHHHLHHHIHQHHPHGKSLASRISSLKKENKTTQTLSIVVGGFIACWLPFFINYLITPFLKEHQASSNLSKGLTWLGWFNSAINPFIYAFYSVDFRAAFWRLTCKRCLDDSNPKSAFPSNTMSIRR